MQNSTPYAIEINALNKIFNTDSGPPVKAIDNLSLSVPCGRMYAILGASGAGKTTLVKIVGGLLDPTGGGVRLNGNNLVKGNSAALSQVRVVPEGTQNISQQLSLWGNLMHYSQPGAWTEKMLKQHARQMLQELDLWKVRDMPISELSRGIQRQVAFMCALITDPPIVVLDEPMSGLDLQASQRVTAWLNSLTRERGKTVLFTTRHPEVAQDLGDDVAILNQGRLVANIPVTDLAISSEQKCYQIKVKSHLGDRWSDWFDNLTVVHTESGETILSGPVRDQAALYGLINKVNSLGLPLLSVTPVKLTLKDMFIHLTSEAHQAGDQA